jgi:hypothetical protein
MFTRATIALAFVLGAAAPTATEERPVQHANDVLTDRFDDVADSRGAGVAGVPVPPRREAAMTIMLTSEQGARSFIEQFDPIPTLQQELVTLASAGLLMGLISGTMAYLQLI